MKKPPLKLSRTTYLLILLIEECAEIIHRTCKAIRFGMDEKQPAQEATNLDRLQGEIDDFETVKDLLYVANVFDTTTGPRSSKREKIQKYMLYSANECATLDLSN